ncbi:MAG: hypothetical protein HYZ47_01115 [Simkania negevensis]|nr:hypothetical protein [Simkania negevensis]
MENDLFLTLFQALITWILIGIAWFTQLVHYPLYSKIKEGFIDYERAHIRRAAYLYGPLMLLELISAVLLVGVSHTSIALKLAMSNLILLILIWLSTFLFQITQHQKLSLHFSKKVFQTLLMANWIRTLLWTVKGILMTIFLYVIFQ